MTLDNLAGTDAPAEKPEDGISLVEAPESIFSGDIYVLPELMKGIIYLFIYKYRDMHIPLYFLGDFELNLLFFFFFFFFF